MPKGKQSFRRTDVIRAVRAVKDVGLIVSAVRFSPQGEIVVETGRVQAQDSASDLERWLAGRANHAHSSKGH
jgi:hypothetical protein